MNIRTFTFLIFCIALVMIATREFVLVDSMYFSSYADLFSDDQIKEMIFFKTKWQWLGYILIPVVYLLKCLAVALCLSLATYFIYERFLYEKMFSVVIKAEFIFIVPALTKLFWFLFFVKNYTIQDFQYFYPLSMLNIFSPNSLEPWLIYPLQVLNIFELIYWIVLAYLLTKELPELDMNRSMTVVMASYGTGLVIWVAFVMFLTLTYT